MKDDNLFIVFTKFSDLHILIEGDKMNFRNDVSGEIISFEQALELIKNSIQDEKEDELFYDSFIKQAPTQMDQEIIRHIRDEERSHNQILRQLYFEFTGQLLPQEQITKDNQVSTNYQSNLEKAFFGEIGAVQKYRKIMSAMPTSVSYGLLMSIMTDELTHVDQFNFLLNR